MQPAFIRFLLGDRSPEVLDAVQADGLRWAEQTGGRPTPLNQYLGMGGPRAARILLRDALLVEAADLLDEGTRWARCCRLAEMARAFNVRRYPIWRRHGLPADASAVDVLLFRACEFGEPLPETAHQWRSVVMQAAQAA